MKLFYARCAKLLNAFGLPIKGLFIHNSRRVRVIAISNQHILLTKSAIGTQKWSLPGGGVKKGESAEAACKRETLEETGVSIHQPLQFLGEKRLPANIKWPVAHISFFATTVKKMKEPAINRPLEILEVRWFPLSALPEDISPTVHVGLKLNFETPPLPS
ncbi:MAG: NUDIX domain-containing protein [Candidatus Saccharimonadales bacterium]